MAALEKTFPCMTCQATIKLERKPDNSGWIRWNIDGTPHEHPRKSGGFQQSSKTLEKVKQLEKKIDTLIAEVQALRKEVQQLKK